MSIARLRRLLLPQLLEKGWAKVPIKRSGMALLLYKRQPKSVLMLGIQCSTLYEERFTAAFYLGYSFTFGLIGPDIPGRAYARVGQFLEGPEKAEFLDPQYQGEGVVDAWWHGFSSEEAEKLLRCVELAEPRFLAQPGLEEEVLRSQIATALRDSALRIRSLVKAGRTRPPAEPFAFKRSNFAPEEWQWGAHASVREIYPEALNPAGVKMWAEDAWCLEHLR